MAKEETSFGMVLFAFLGMILIIPVLSFIYAFVQVKLYDWFVIPIFHTPAISVGWMYGLTLLLSTFRHYCSEPKETKPNYGTFLVPFISFGIGYVLHTWVL